MLEVYRQNYNLRNKSTKGKELIYPLGNRGFFSELNNLTLAVLYCLDNNIKLKLYSKKWVSGNWKDYFIPLIEEYNGIIPIPIDLYVENRRDKFFRKYHKLIKHRLIVQDTIWYEMRNENFTNRHFHYPDLGINGNIFDAKRQILKLILNYNITTTNEIKTFDNTLINVVEESCGIHIRRGDKVSGKSKEAESFDIETYVNKALQINPHLTTFILCTDDYEVVEDFKKKYTEFKIISYCPKNRKGYSQKEYNKTDQSEKRKEVIAILRDCFLLINSKIFIGTYSSNVARYIVLMRNDIECYSLDTTWSPL